MNRNCIRLQMQNGQTALVDLGTRISLSELDIAPNDLITIQGRRTTLNGRQVFRANRIWINGDETRLNPSQSAGRSQISLQK